MKFESKCAQTSRYCSHFHLYTKLYLPQHWQWIELHLTTQIKLMISLTLWSVWRSLKDWPSKRFNASLFILFFLHKTMLMFTFTKGDSSTSKILRIQRIKPKQKCAISWKQDEKRNWNDKISREFINYLALRNELNWAVIMMRYEFGSERVYKMLNRDAIVTRVKQFKTLCPFIVLVPSQNPKDTILNCQSFEVSNVRKNRKTKKIVLYFWCISLGDFSCNDCLTTIVLIPRHFTVNISQLKSR